ncbi:response regulator [Simiduia agarivorans]|uniref:Chemotaxis protein CheA n=1 Tax=Simiduia agarivorans (strain DSM 21679 / JCM 13881 / BCRC 17597 / SA1) TaxID=1117647 RepID=K4KZ21_SIMAS|nr:response regulator [Simiduia agarivorans]AFU99147.1 chemotaxis protein CheA [Simiduia agarivorans SA1 = DSM 21679]
MTVARRVMLVEDNEDHRLLIRAALAALRVDLVSFASAEAALAGSPKEFDLILADVRLAGMSGIEFAGHCSPLGVPVVMLSTSEDPEDIAACLQAGAAGYVTKATGIEALRSKLSEVLATFVGEHKPPTQNR